MDNLNVPPNQYLYDTPSPYVGQFKKLTSILNADPTSIPDDEIKNRLNTYYQNVPEPTAPEGSIVGNPEFQKFRKVQNDVTNGYLDDVAKTRNLPQLNDFIQKDLNMKSQVPVQFVPGQTGLQRGGDTMNKGGDISTNVYTGNNTPFENPETSLMHELMHAKDFQNGFKPGKEVAQIPSNSNAGNDLFSLSNKLGSTGHHSQVLSDNGNPEPAMLMRPFERINEPRRGFEKLRQLLVQQQQ